MSSYNVVADLGQSIVNLLRRNLCPDIIKNEKQIGLCSPIDKGDFALGVYIYLVNENVDDRRNEMIVLSEKLRQYPPISLKVSLMITAYSKANTAVKAVDEYRIMGKAIQTLFDNKVLNKVDLVGSLAEQEDRIVVDKANLDFDAQVRIWSMFNEPYRLSAFYDVTPLLINSERTIETERVRSVDIGIGRV